MTTAGGEDPVAAALARIKAKQETAQVVSEPAPDNGHDCRP
jgi:electron transport complex protein RnfC